MMTNPLNPLSDLAEYEPPKQHTSGRRELNVERNARVFTIHSHPKNQDEALKAALTGQMVETLPIRRAKPKVTKKERKLVAKMKRLKKEGKPHV